MDSLTGRIGMACWGTLKHFACENAGCCFHVCASFVPPSTLKCLDMLPVPTHPPDALALASVLRVRDVNHTLIFQL